MVETYVDKLESILSKRRITSPDVEVVFLIGLPVEEKDNPQLLKDSMNSISPGSRIVHYESLIQNTKNAYHEYL